MNYIINPAVFYWMSVVDAICFWAVGSAALSGVAAVILFCIKYFDDYLDANGVKSMNKIIKTLSIVCIVSIVVTIFTPSKDTMIQMLVAKCATYDNANWTLETIKSAVDYIVEAIKSLK